MEKIWLIAAMALVLVSCDRQIEKPKDVPIEQPKDQTKP